MWTSLNDYEGPDYAERRVRRLDSFLVATTELRLYALSSVLGPG